MDFFSDIIAQLAQEKVASPRLEAREIFAFVLQKDIAEIYSGCEVNYEQKQQIEKLVKKRLSHCPLDKIREALPNYFQAVRMRGWASAEYFFRALWTGLHHVFVQSLRKGF